MMDSIQENKVIHHRMVSGELKPNFPEVYRYLGYTKYAIIEDDVKNLVEKCVEEMQAAIKPQGIYAFFNLEMRQNSNEQNSESVHIKFSDVEIDSIDLGRNLNGCSKIVLMAATVGPQVDSIIKKYTKLDTAKAAVMQAVGAMFIEEYVDYLNHQIEEVAKKSGFSRTKPRYSPGFGDISLAMQKDFFRLLPCTQRLGLTLMQTNIMAPEKSVTAFVGICP